MVNKENNREVDILEAAKDVFHRKGMAGARMQEIADKAGINKALLHYYYRTKQLLFEAVFKQAFNIIGPKLGSVLNSELSLEEKIRSFTNKYVSFIIKHPYLPNFIIQELNSNPQFIEQLVNNDKFPDITGFKNQVEKLIEDGKIRPIDANQLFINIISLNIFPFIGKPLLKGFLNVDDATYSELIEQRKTETANFIINAIKID